MGDTPADHVVIALRIPADLLPAWFEEVKKVAFAYVRRMAVIEKPDEWIVRCELPKDRVEAFHAALSEAWARFSS